MSDPKTVLQRLAAVINDRFVDRPADSYASVLFDGGPPLIGAKIREEAEELAEAVQRAGDESRSQVIHEAADVLFHLLVLLRAADVSFGDVTNELERREGVSGLEEKRTRHSPPTRP